MPRPAHRTTVIPQFASARERAGISRSPGIPPAPFRQCPPVGADRGCEDLIQVTDGGRVIVADPGEGPFDGSAGALVGVLNSSRRAISAVKISADSKVFGFAGDGICDAKFGLAGKSAGKSDKERCPFGSTGYEGPGTSFTGISADGNSGTVTFSTPLAPGKSVYFSLAQALAASQVAGGGPTTREQGGAPNLAEPQSACSQQQPVNCATGYFWQQFTDFSVPGRGAPLDLTRTYMSGAASTDSVFGYGWTDSYAMHLKSDPGGQETVVQEDGAPVTFRPDGTGGYTAPARVLATLTRNGDGTVTFARNASPLRYVFSASSGLLLRESDLNGDTTTLAYQDGRLTWVTDPARRSLHFGYDAQGHVTSASDPMPHRTREFRYQGGNLVWMRDGEGRVWQFGYGPGHLMTWMKDPQSHVTRIQYGASGQVRSVAEPGRGTATWRYHDNPAAPQGGTTTQVGPGRAVTTYEYAALELTAVTSGTGTRATATTGYTYSPAGLVRSVTDPDLDVTTDTYDQFGNLTSTTNPLGQATRYSYDGRLGQATLVITPAGTVTRNWYDSRGNLLKSADGNENITRYGYGNPADSYHPGDPEHRSDLISVTGPTHQTTRYAYDHFGDVESVTLPSGVGTVRTTLYAYDADGELTCMVPPDAQAHGVTCPAAGVPHVAGTLTYGYDLDGEQAMATGADGAVTSTRYDGDGNLMQVTDPDKNVTTYHHGPAGEQTSEIVGTTTVTASTYDALGDLATQASGPHGITRYTYDILGRLVAATDPLHRTTRYGYDHAGHLTSITDPSGRITTYAYDKAAELTKVTYSSGIPSAVTYSYYSDGQLRSMTDGTGVTRYVRDGDRRLTSAVHTSPAGAVNAYEYSYDDETGTSTLTYPNGGQVTDTYNGAGLLTSVQDWLGNTISFSYDAQGNLTAEQFPGGVAAAYRGASLSVTNGGGTLARFSDTTDKDGLITSAATSGLPGTSTVGYSYTALGQLSSAGSAQYQYDADGNPTLINGQISQAFDAAGQLERTSAPDAAPAGYAYDRQGNLTAAGSSVRLTYNQADQLTGYRSAGMTATYSYAGDGLRSSKTVNGIAADYTWDQSQATPKLLAAGDTSYLYGPGGQPVEQITGGTPTYLLADQQGNTRLVTSESGTVVGTYNYTPYGVSSHHGQSTALQYQGQYADAESGYVYLRARYYDPATAQFLTRDPAAASGGSPYAYAGGDPVNASDPTGLSWNPISLVTVPFSLLVDAGTAVAAATVAAARWVFGTASWAASTVYSVGAQGLTDAADFVGQHWRGLVQAALFVGVMALGVACDIASDGFCVVLNAPLVKVAMDIVEGVGRYLTSPGQKSWSGAASSGLQSAGTGAVIQAASGPVLKKFFPPRR